jgi:hypothetical protein
MYLSRARLAGFMPPRGRWALGSDATNGSNG